MSGSIPPDQGRPAPACAMPSRFDSAFLPSIRGYAVWDWDLRTDTLTFSEEWRNILLYAPGEPLTTHREYWWSRIHEEDRDLVRASADALLSGQSSSMDVTFRLQRSDGCWAWVVSRGAAWAGEPGGTTRVSGLVLDISNLRSDSRFQQGTDVGDSCYHSMLENSPDMIVRMDRDLFPLYINPMVSRVMDRKPDEFTCSETTEELGIDPRQLAFLQKNVNRVFDEGISVREMVTFSIHKHTEFTGEYSFWPEFGPDGKVKSVITQFRDLTEQVRAQEEAHLNAMRLTALHQLSQMDNASEDEVMRFVVNKLLELTKSPLGFIFIPGALSSDKGRMLWSSGHGRFMDKERLITDTFPLNDFYLASSRQRIPDFRVMDNGDGVNPIHSCFGGKMQVMRCIFAPAMEGERVVCIAGACNKETDYEEEDLQQVELFMNSVLLLLRRKMHIQSLQKAKERAEAANKIKDEFLANVSHELRTPLNGVLGMLQLLEFSSLDEEQQRFVRTAALSGNALLRIISDILDFSRLESGKMQLQEAPLELKPIIHSAIDLFAAEAEQKKLSIRVHVDKNVPQWLMGDDARIRQILYNLAGNAIKFTEKGGIEVICSRLPHNRYGKHLIYLCVSDTGIGIPVHLQKAIFEAFTQINGAKRTRQPGTGLGLGIVKGLVHMMGGTLTVDSARNKGTAIHCALPLAPARPAPERAGRSVSPNRSFRPLDILVAEDDAVARFTIRALLKRMGHTIVCVSDGRQALEALMLHRFDCLFTDIRMPVMDGLELVTHIREGDTRQMTPSREVEEIIARSIPWDERKPVVNFPTDIPIAAVSAHAMSGDKERFLSKGIDLYLSKPVILEELTRVLERIHMRELLSNNSVMAFEAFTS